MADNQGQFAEQNAAGTWASSPGVYDNYFNVGRSSGQIISRFRDCPAEPALPGANPASGGGFVNSMGKTVKVNYLHVRFNPKVGSRIYNIAKIGNPSSKLLMCDGYWNNGTAVANIQSPTHVVTADDGLVMTQDDTTGNLIPKYDMGEILKDRHGGNGQIIFCDGHAESLPWADWVANIPQQPFTTVPAAGDEGKNWTVIQYQ